MRRAIHAARNLLGVVAYDLPIYARLAQAGPSYLAIRNRRENVEAGPAGPAYRCDWQWTSDLHAPKVVPALGRALMRRALRDHPVRRTHAVGAASSSPEVSFVIGHRGHERLPHLLATLETVAAQEGPSIECIVVEQDEREQLAGKLPGWVRAVHVRNPAGQPYCRSWGLNVGAAHARGRVLVLHDNDMLVPADYAAQVADRVARGYEVVDLKRFVFYLSAEHTREIFDGESDLAKRPPQSVVQNLLGGGSVAITRDAFERIGGMDESFIGWGGEDNEFWERAGGLRVWPWANLPLVHLWHAPQPGKQDARNPAVQLYTQRSKVPPAERIAALRARPRGLESGPQADAPSQHGARDSAVA
jgi:hypothetical protein